MNISVHMNKSSKAKSDINLLIDVILILVVISYQILSYTWIGITINSNCFRVLIVVCLLRFVYVCVHRTIVDNCTIIFMVLFLASICITIFMQRSEGFFSTVTPYLIDGIFIYFFCIVKCFNDRYFFATLMFVFALISIITFIGLILYCGNQALCFCGSEYATVVNGRITGIYTNANQAAFVNLVACYFAGFLISSCKNRILNDIILLGTVFDFVFLAKTDSRSAKVAIIATIIAFIGFYLYKAAFKMGKKLLIFIIAGVIAGSACFFAFNLSRGLVDVPRILSCKESSEQISSTPDRGETDISSGRLEIWMDGVELFLEEPLFGMSHNDIKNHLAQNSRNLIAGDKVERNMQTHNSYLYILITTGMVGFFIYFTYWISRIWIMVKNVDKKQDIYLLGCICALFIEAFFLTVVFNQIEFGTTILYLCGGRLLRLNGNYTIHCKIVTRFRHHENFSVED